MPKAQLNSYFRGLICMAISPLLMSSLMAGHPITIDGKIESGTREFHWNGNNQPSGVYFIKLSSSDYNQTRKMVLLK
jgi:hypothetical protein